MLAWDKELERELPLALRSAALWATLAQELDDDFEYDRKGSVVVAETPEELVAAAERSRTLAGLGVAGEVLDADALRREEPHAAPDLPGGVLYPGRRAGRAAARHRRARPRRPAARGRAQHRVTSSGSCAAATAAPPRSRPTAGGSTPAWSSSPPASGARRCSTPQAWRVPVTPRKGHVVVLERSPVSFRRKLSEAGYVAAVEADDAALQVAMVVESTPAGTTLLGSSRQHVGFDREVELSVAGAIARRAARFFPVLRDARALRVYTGLRPLTPDHLPIIGPFARGAEPLRRHRARGRRDRARARDRRARRGLAHRRALPASARVVLAGPLRPRGAPP